MKKSHRIILVALIIPFYGLSLHICGAFAATIAWDGDTSAAWATGSNWTGGSAPTDNTTTDTASFNLATAYNDTTQFNPVITGSRSVNGLSIGAANATMTLSGGTLTVGGGNISVASTAITTISTAIAGTADLTKSGSGELHLTGTEANTYTGTTFVNTGATGGGLWLGKDDGVVAVAGNVELTNDTSCKLKMEGNALHGDNQFGSTSVISWKTTVVPGPGTFSGARFELNGHNQTVAGLDSSDDSAGWGIIQDGGLSDGNVGNATLTINTAAGQSYSYNGYMRDYDPAGGRTDKLSIIKTGDGTQILSGSTSWGGSTAATYTGATTISAGTLQIGDGGTLGGLSASSAITIASGATLAFNRTNTVTQDTDFSSSAISGAGGITQAGSGTLILKVANTYTGPTTVSAGTLQLGAAGVISDSSAVTVNGTLDLNNKNETVGSLAGSGTVTSTAAGSITLTAGGDNTSTTFSGVAQNGSGTVAFTKAGTGTLKLSGANTYTGATTINSGGTLQIGDAGTTGKLSTSSAITDNGTLAFNRTNTVAQGTDFSTAAITGTGGLTQLGSGSTLLLNAANTYSGTTNLSAGTLQVGVASVGAVGAITSSAVGTGALALNGGVISSNGATARTLLNAVTFDGDVTLGDATNTGKLTFSAAANLGGTTRTLTTASDAQFDGVVSNGGLTKAGTGTLTLGGTNTYTGATTVNAGTLKAGIATQAFGNSSAVTVGASGTLDLGGFDETIGSLAGSGTLTNSGAAKTLTAGGDNTSTTFSGVIQNGAGATAFTKAGSGTLTLSGANTYSGTMTIGAGTLAVSNASGLGTGAVTNNATLDVGTTGISGIGKYTQAASSTFAVTVASESSAGKLSSTTAADVSATSTVAVTVGTTAYISTGTAYTVIDTVAGGAFNVPGTITSSSSRIAFTGSASNGDLILTISRATNGFASNATDSNGRAVGTVLDNVTSPSSDMTAVLNTMEGLSNSQVASALDTLDPEVDSGTYNNSTAMLDNFIGVAIERVRDVLRLAQNPSANAGTGISTGDDELLNGIWGKGYGSYMDQGERKGIQGYNAWNTGTALGIDRLFADLATIGISGGWAYGNVDSDANNGNTYINSAQGTLYAGYRNDTYPFYIDASGSFAWNWYNGKRDITVGTIQRTANASYDGQQYGVYLGGGYDFPVYKKVNLTPLLSLQWMHLNLKSYTETEAGALNLSVASQAYDILQSGLGASISGPIEFKWGRLIPEIHGKWLYDFFGESVVMTSTFTGGGASFDANGFKPAQNSFNIGGKLGVDLKNNISVLGECDTELKDEFWGIYGAVTVRYTF